MVAQEWGLGRRPCPAPPAKCGAGSWQEWKHELAPQRNLSFADIQTNYSSGPPWLIHVDDLRAIVSHDKNGGNLWQRHYALTKPRRDTIYTEQVSFSSALAARGIAQVQLRNLQASWPRARFVPPSTPYASSNRAGRDFEAWHRRAAWAPKDGELAPIPMAAAVFHYHQWLGVGPLRFHKGHVPGLHGPADEFILACGAPLLIEPPPPRHATHAAPSA